VVQRRDASAAQLSSLYWLNVFAGMVVGAVVALAAPLVAAFFRDPALVAPLRVTSLLFVIIALGKQFEVLLQRELAFDVLARVEVAAAVLGVGMAIAVALTADGTGPSWPARSPRRPRAPCSSARSACAGSGRPSTSAGSTHGGSWRSAPTSSASSRSTTSPSGSISWSSAGWWASLRSGTTTSRSTSPRSPSAG
jgi:hypothetical protein